jgi:hypothetical protein
MQNLPRYNIYGVIHKALRGMMFETLAMVGRMDVADACERNSAIQAVRDLLNGFLSHLDHENRFIHPALEKALPGSSAHIAHEHVEHQAAIADLFALLTTFEKADDRTQLGHTLYLALTEFVAENLEHMAEEETTNNAALTSAYSDLELLMIEQQIVASIAPEEMGALLPWMLRFMNADERAFMLRGMKSNAPPPVFEGVRGMARTHLTQHDFYKLELALA